MQVSDSVYSLGCHRRQVVDSLGLRSPNEKASFSIDDRRGSAVIEDEEDDVIGPAYCPVCGPGDALCAKYGYAIQLYYVNHNALIPSTGRITSLAR
jgi:hypothetical protein